MDISSTIRSQNLYRLSGSVNNISSNTKVVTHSILEIAQNLYRIKTEFLVYDKLINGNIILNKRPFDIRDVLMTVLYPFFVDFRKKNVFVDVEPYYNSVMFDFETIQVAFYHIIENISKYVKPDTDIIISFPVDGQKQRIEFKMTSLHIENDEIDKIFNENYSGKQAVKNELNGEGIGIFRARKLFELNNGYLSVEAGQDITVFHEAEYATNIFICEIPLI